MSKRLLILVDDEPVTSRTLALDLADAGYSVETAEDRGEAIRMMERAPFDLLIAPERRGGGRGLVEEFRRVHPGAKVVLMTTDPDARRPLEWRDTVARVKKPFDLEEFRSVVERLLRAPRTDGAHRVEERVANGAMRKRSVTRNGSAK